MSAGAPEPLVVSAGAPEPLVSLILCVKNGLPYLQEALDSVASQTYRRFELVVQDGASTDESVSVIERSRGRVPFLDAASAPDTGIGQAYNRAVRRCRGEIVGSIDSDNLLESDALARIVAAFGEHQGCAAICCGTNIVDHTGAVLERFTPAPFDVFRLLESELVPPFATSFFSRAVCGEELRFDESLKTCADFDLWLRLSRHEIVSIADVVGRTRLSAKSMTCDPARYDQFCRDKIRALEQALLGDRRGSVAEAVYKRAVVGVYLWAATSMCNIEGAASRFAEYCGRAAAVDPSSEALRRLRAYIPGGRATWARRKPPSPPAPTGSTPARP